MPKKKDKVEDVQIFGPDELIGMNVKDIIKMIPSPEDEKAKKKDKIKPAGFEHYYTESPTSEIKERILECEFKNGHKYLFKAPTGVYGKSKIDKATRILIENASFNEGSILDIGCGYGVIGITIKKEFNSMKVFMSDVNKRAVEYAKINAKDNNADVEIKSGNLFDPWEDVIFDNIIANPPIVAGKNIWMNLIEKGYKHLSNKGTLNLVAFHNKGGKRIEEYMKEIFGNVTELEKSGGIRVYKSVKEV